MAKKIEGKSTLFRKWWNVLHISAGYTCVLSGIVNCTTGIVLYCVKMHSAHRETLTGWVINLQLV